MKSLFYVCDRLRTVDYHTWEGGWAARRGSRSVSEDPDARSATFQSYLALCEAYISAEHQEHEVSCLRELFRGCRNVREVTVTCQAACNRRLNGSRTAFDKVGITPDERYDWKDAGVSQIINLAHAAVASDHCFDSLTLAGISHRLWNPRNYEEVLDVQALIQPLRRLRVTTLSMTEIEEDEMAKVVIPSEATANFRAGRFQEMLAVASNLRVLKLHFAPYLFAGKKAVYQQSRLHVREIYLKDILGILMFPHLYELAISSCGTTSGYLEEVLLRHKQTLRRLTLSHIHMVTVDLHQFFHNVAGWLPELRKITLHGITDPQPWGPPGFRARVTQGSPDNSLVKYEVENYMLNGGIPPQWNNHFNWVGSEVIATQKEDYLQSGLPEDNTISDDPKLDYAWDEFDDRF